MLIGDETKEAVRHGSDYDYEIRFSGNLCTNQGTAMFITKYQLLKGEA